MSSCSISKKKFFEIIIVAFLFSIQIFAQNTYYVSPSGNDSNVGSSVSPWLTIQGAINNSSVVNGDIIIVKDGTYNENVNVTKEITLRSENGYLATTVIAANYQYDVFKITANNVTIDDFTIYGTTYRWNYGGAIELIGVNNCTITNNCCGLDDIHNNLMGVILKTNSDNNTISNPTTKIKYQIPERSGNYRVVLKVYDVLGNELTTLVNEVKHPGIYKVNFNGSKYASGVYYYKITVGNAIQTKKMILMK